LKWYYLLFALILLFFVPSCSASRIASSEVVISHLGDIQEYDRYDTYVTRKLIGLSIKKLLEGAALKQELHNYDDAAYAYYSRAYVLLASGDVAGYKENLDKAWDMLEELESLLDEIALKAKPELKKEGQGL